MLELSMATVLARLESGQAEGLLRPLDVALAEFVAAHVPAALAMHPPAERETLTAALTLAAALTSHQAGRGHVCLDLTQLAANPIQTLGMRVPPSGADLPEQTDSFAAWLGQPTVCVWLTADQLNASGLVSGAAMGFPLRLHGHRLYLLRAWTEEQRVAGALAARARRPPTLPDVAAVQQSLVDLFGVSRNLNDWGQRQAVALALTRQVLLLTGGPGTGKTTTVLRMLVALQWQRQAAGQALAVIKLAAPTGKAAVRLSSAVKAERDKLVAALPSLDPALSGSLPSEVVTLHRLLGVKAGSRHFAFNHTHPLAVDIVVVDEASMVDLSMMAALVDALPAHTTLILVGDRNQLASVEAGAVLGQLCAAHGDYPPEVATWLAAVTGHAPAPPVEATHTGLAAHTAVLTHSFRFGGDSGIGRLAEAVRQGDVAATESVWRQQPPHLSRHSQGGALLHVWGSGGGYRPYLEAVAARPALVLTEGVPDAAQQAVLDAWATAVLGKLGHCQVLAALRQGAWGVDKLNQRLVSDLTKRGRLTYREGEVWYAGRPVMMTQNDYALGLMNGDVGVTLAWPTGGLRVAFYSGEGTASGIRWVSINRLPKVETALAITVHKSQGSEYTHALLVLPPHAGAPILSRELVYTALTRAKQHFTLFAPPPTLGEPAARTAVFDVAVGRQILRESGLAEAVAGFGTGVTPLW